VKLLIKIGGTLLDDEAHRNAIASQLAELARSYQIAAVHGGGKQLTRFLEERGVQSQFVRGLRVSDAAVIDGVIKVIAGSVNKELVSAIVRAGQPAVGLSGIDGPLTLASLLDPALGSVGRPRETNGRLLDLLSAAGYLPVVACIASDEHGNIYNVNADQMAVSCAEGWSANKLIFLTDVAGVKNGQGEILPELTPEAVTHLIDSGVARGGMHAKLDAALSALRSGLREIVIAPGHEPDVCLRLLHGEPLGTRLSHESHAMESLQR